MSQTSVVVLISYRAQAGQEAAAQRELTSLIETVVQKEPDCSGITMLVDATDPARILLHELWTSRDAYLGPHMQTPHIQAFIRRAGQLMSGPPEITYRNQVAAF